MTVDTWFPWRLIPGPAYKRDTGCSDKSVELHGPPDIVFVEPIEGGWGARLMANSGEEGHLDGPYPTPEKAMEAADEAWPWKGPRTPWWSPQLKIGPGQTGLDPEVAELVWAMNRLPGIETNGSCCGHGNRPFVIYFIVTDFEARGLLTLSRLLSHNYHFFWQFFKVILDHRDVDPQVCFRIEGESTAQVFAAADELAKAINACVDDTVEYYNILTDRRGPPRVPTA